MSQDDYNLRDPDNMTMSQDDKKLRDQLGNMVMSQDATDSWR